MTKQTPPKLGKRSVSGRFASIVELVWKERRRQDEKWGWPQDHTLPEWSAVLGEEYGECCQEILRVHFGGKPTEDLVQETVQVAAVAVAMLEDWFERGLITLD